MAVETVEVVIIGDVVWKTDPAWVNLSVGKLKLSAALFAPSFEATETGWTWIQGTVGAWIIGEFNWTDWILDGLTLFKEEIENGLANAFWGWIL